MYVTPCIYILYLKTMIYSDAVCIDVSVAHSAEIARERAIHEESVRLLTRLRVMGGGGDVVPFLFSFFEVNFQNRIHTSILFLLLVTPTATA